MTTTQVFETVNAIVIPAWLALIFFPGKAWRNTAIYTFCILMALIYVWYVLGSLSSFDPSAFGSLAGVKDLFTNDEAVLAGWVHYLTFDLLIGNWVVNQSRKFDIKHLLVVLCLFGCFMFGPLGFLLFSIIKFLKNKTLADNLE